MRRIFSVQVILAAMAALLMLVPPAEAQLGGLARRAKRAAAKSIEEMIANAAKCVVDDQACAEQAEKDGKQVVYTDDQGNVLIDDEGQPVTDPEEARRLTGKTEGNSEAPGESVWRNYDFVPGQTVWFASDFSGEPVGRFPARQLEFLRGNMQIVELHGSKVLEVSSSSVFRVHLPDVLPDDFTIEFNYKAASANTEVDVHIGELKGVASKSDKHFVRVYHRAGIVYHGNMVSSLDGIRVSRQMLPVRIQVDGDPEAPDYSIVYVGSQRVAQVPNATFPRAELIEFRMSGNNRRRSYISNIVVAVGLDSLYDSLMANGEFTTHGILFDVGSADLRPESTPTLEEILTALTGHPDLSLVIEGHTDATGDDDQNLELSGRRAQSVVRYLRAKGIAENRLSARGRGETEPVADNDTPVGRQQNRRVVIRVADPQ